MLPDNVIIPELSYAQKREKHGRKRRNKIKVHPNLYCAYDVETEQLAINSTVIDVGIEELYNTITEIHTIAKLGSPDTQYYFRLVLWVCDLEGFCNKVQSYFPEVEETINSKKTLSRVQYPHCYVCNLDSILKRNALYDFTNLPNDSLFVERIAEAGKKFMQTDLPYGFLRAHQSQHLKEILELNYINEAEPDKTPSKVLNSIRTWLWGKPWTKDANNRGILDYRYFCNYTEEGHEIPLEGIKTKSGQYYNLLRYSDKSGLMLLEDELNEVIQDVYDCDISACHSFSMLVCPTVAYKLYPVWDKKVIKHHLEECKTFDGVFHSKYCYFMCVTYTNLRPKYPIRVMHYDKDSLKIRGEYRVKNNYVDSADSVTLWVTGYDFLLYSEYYDYDDVIVNTFLRAGAGSISAGYKTTILDALEKKYSLRNKEKKDPSLSADAYLAKLDTEMLYGITIQENYTNRENSDLEWSHLYQRLTNPMWGIMCVSFSRTRLGLVALEMIKNDPFSVHYGDTDSIKVDNTEYNKTILYNNNQWARQELAKSLPKKYHNLLDIVGQWMNESWKSSNHYTEHLETLVVYKPKQYAVQYQTTNGIKTDITWAGVPKAIINEAASTIPDIINNLNDLAEHPLILKWQSTTPQMI